MVNRVSRADVASLAGVSKTTVSYVFSGRPDAGIPEATRQRVIEAARQLGYIPNRAAQSLRTGQTNLVALWMSVLCPIYYAQIVSDVQDLLREAGYEMMVTDTAPHRDWEAHLDRLAQWPVDGVIAFDSARYVSRYRQKYGAHGVPFVSMGVDIDPTVDHVRLQLDPGAHEAMEHLQAVGGRFAFLADRYGLDASDARYAAYLSAMRTMGAQLEVIECAARSRSAAKEAIRRHVAERGAPRAIFCFNDDLAIGAHRALRDLGLSIPRDVAIVGHDGTDDTDYLDPRLSTVRVPSREMCHLAWRFLHARMEDRRLDVQSETLATRLEIRASSDLTLLETNLQRRS